MSFLGYLHVMAVGFVAAAAIVAGYRVWVGRPASFAVAPGSVLGGIAHCVVLSFGGPAILLRNGYRGRRIEGRAWGFVVAGALIAAGWSFLSGVVILTGVHEALGLLS